LIISQGNEATDLRWGGRFYSIFLHGFVCNSRRILTAFYALSHLPKLSWK